MLNCSKNKIHQTRQEPLNKQQTSTPGLGPCPDFQSFLEPLEHRSNIPLGMQSFIFISSKALLYYISADRCINIWRFWMFTSLIGSHEDYVPRRENIFGLSEIFFFSLKNYQKNMTQWRIFTENVRITFSWARLL